MSGLRVALVQLRATERRSDNALALGEWIEAAVAVGSDLVVLPEACGYRGRFREELVEDEDGETLTAVSELARRHATAVLVGGLWLRSAARERPYNTSVFVSPEGIVAAAYRKAHLFRIASASVTEDQSRYTTPGDGLVAVRFRGFQLGLSICFDLRFPGLYRALARSGCDVLVVPANFARYTGKDHWEVLVRARAIENGCYVLAPAQFGEDETGFLSHGHTLAIDPWGTVLAGAGDGPEFVCVELKRERVAAARAEIDIAASERRDLYATSVTVVDAG